MIRIIADENISWRLKRLLPSWEVLPANEILASRLSDHQIWDYAKANSFTILTFDEDFADLQGLYSWPPKIIWLRTGNCPTKQIAELMLSLEKSLTMFLADPELGIYEIYLD